MSTLMLETKEIFETLLLNSTLTQLFIWEAFSTECTSFTCHSRTKRYCNCLFYCFCIMMLQNIHTKREQGFQKVSPLKHKCEQV
jgi:hypothetical protein